MLARRMGAGVLVIAGVVLLSGSTASAASKAEKMQENFALVRLPMCDAIRITEAQTGGRVFKAELKRDDGRVFYKIEFVLGNQTLKTEVDALIVPAPAGGRMAPPSSGRPARLPARSALPGPAEEPPPRPEPIQPQTMPPAQAEPAAPPSPPLPPSGIVIPFDTEPVGGLPAGFTAVETGGGGTLATWKVTAEDTAPSRPNVVEITENMNGPSTFSVLVANQPVLADVDVGVKVRVTGGTDSNSAGLVWRYQDPGNYYVAAYNRAENALDVWRVKDGKRKRIGTGPAGSGGGQAGWHEVHVEMKGDQLTAFLDGKRIVSQRDFTFAEPGKVGFWVNGDTKAEFDDLTVADMNAAPR